MQLVRYASKLSTAFLAGAVLLFAAGASSPDPYSRGSSAFNNRQYAEAAEALQQAESTNPGKTPALLLRAKALVHLRQYAEAEESIRGYLNANPHSADAKFLLGYILFRRDQPEKSLAIYTAAAALERPQPDDFKIVGLDYVLLNDYPEAIKWLERSVRENPKDAEAVYYLGRAYYARNWFDRAIALFEQALALNPRFGKAENNLGLALAAQDRLEAAEAAYRKAIEIDSASDTRNEQPYINLAELLIDHNRVPEALQLLDAARAIPTRVDVDKIEQLRGRSLLQLNRLPEAEAAFRAALAVKPENANLHYQLGRVLRRLGKDDEARQEFERSKALLGTHSASPY